MIHSKEALKHYQTLLEPMHPQEILTWAIHHFGADHLAFATSLGAEDQVLTDMISKMEQRPKVFTLDTGRLHEETYALIDRCIKYYHLEYVFLCPDAADLQTLLSWGGPNLFYDSLEQRKRCCQVRKIRPLSRYLSNFRAWICGLRRDQSQTRVEVKKIEWDEQFGLFKINPLVEWSQTAVWNYIREKNVPYNPLHDRGFPSIGCEPCTRAIAAGEDLRAGRWWWENEEKKECGLHQRRGR